MTLKLLQLGKTEYGNFEISNKNTFFDILKLETKDLTIGNKPLNYRHLQEKSSSNVIHSTTRIEITNTKRDRQSQTGFECNTLNKKDRNYLSVYYSIS